MASPAPNGSYLQHADPQNFPANPTGAPPPNNYQAPVSAQADQQHGQTPEVPKDEVGWYFVEQYYTTLNKSPDRVHLFYNKKSTMVWGTEGESIPVTLGRPEKISAHQFKDCKVRVSNVDSQASADNGIVIQVLGEMSNDGNPNRKFSQTFFLAEQPNGYFVLNDIFRYLKDDDDIEEGDEYDYVEDATGDTIADVAEQVPLELIEEQFQDLSVTETTSVEVETAQGDKVKVEESVTVEPAATTTTASTSTVVQDALAAAINGSAEPLAPGASVQPAATAAAAAAAEPEVEAEEPTTAPAEAAAPATPESAAPEAPEAAAPASPSPAPAEAEQSVDLSAAAPPAVEEKPAPTPTPTPPALAPAPAPVLVSPPPVMARPKTWANVVTFNAKPATPPAAQPPTAAATPTAAPPVVQTPAPVTAAPPAPATPVTPTSSGSGSQWQTADSKRHSRATTTGQTQAFVKGVTDAVSEKALKDALTKYGNLKYFEVIRQKNCAFVEFETPAAFSAASSQNPHNIAGSSVLVEERHRPIGGYGRRGLSGRGDGRPAAGRGFPPRGEGRGFDGGRGGRGAGRFGARGGGIKTATSS